MVEIKRLKKCTIEEGVNAWNTGFEGYYFNATTTPDQFVNRMAAEGLSSELSVVAFMEEEPIGIIKNGIRNFNGVKMAWNGGTGIATPFRKKGVGRQLMKATLDILKEEAVTIATLEAISENQKAISLYESVGYQIVDQLEYLELKGALEQNPLTDIQSFPIEKGVPQQVAGLSFYKGLHPWQTQWQNAKDGEAVIAKDQDGDPIGYAYFRRLFNEKGEHAGIILLQCEANSSRDDGKEIIKFLLSQVFHSFSDDIKRVIPNIPVTKSKLTYNILKAIGFETTVKQVFMVKEM